MTRYNTQTGAQLACNSTQNNSLTDYVLKVSQVLLSICLASQLYYPLSIPPEQRLRLVRETGTLAHVYYTDRDVLRQWEPSFLAQH